MGEHWEPVAVRRKSDGRYLADLRNPFGVFSTEPRFIQSAAKARVLIRVDLGRDLDDFEIIPRDQVLGLKRELC